MTGRIRRTGRRLAVLAAVTGALAVAVSPTAGLGASRRAVAAAPVQSRCGSHPWCDTTLSPARRARMLLAAMSPDDKVGIMTGMAASDVDMPAIKFTDGAVGVGGAGEGIGHATAMPSGTALAATFNRRLDRRYGATVGAEVRHRGFDGDWGPTVNIMRTPLGGRTFEGYGEDPALVASTAVGWIRGFQSKGVIATVKHFALNNEEGQSGAAPGCGVDGCRLLVNAVVGQRAIHEIYLRAFQAAVQHGHTGSIMCSYNEINGVYACANRWLLTHTLRKQWGFRGFVQSDAGSCHETADDLHAGMHFDIVGTCYSGPLIDAALAAGTITQQDIDRNDFQMLRALFRYGFFDHAEWPSDPSLDRVKADTAVADRTAEQGAVLLRTRRHILPLGHRVRKIAVIGSAAQYYNFGGGSSQVKPAITTTALQGLRRAAARRKISLSYDNGLVPATAAALAKKADVAIVVAADSSSEGEDKACMSLVPKCANSVPTLDDHPAAIFGDQDAMIEKVAAANPHTVVVLEAGAPVLTPWRHQVAGLLDAWYPGGDGGTAIARLLFGQADPGGRLPVTFPRKAGDIPTAGSTAKYPGTVSPKNPAHLAAHYSEGVMVGYRWYDEHHIKPAYPFGFGLGYTRFRFSHLAVRRHGSGARVAVTVSNVGHRAGWAVPEVYVGLPSARRRHEPPRQLAGFAKLRLAPGRSRRVHIHLSRRDFAYWSTAAHTFRVARGCDTISVGTSSRDLPLVATIGHHGAPCRGSAGRRRR